MRTFNITAQVYESNDSSKQTILLNREIKAESEEKAILKFKGKISFNYKLVKIYSVEEIFEPAT